MLLWTFESVYNEHAPLSVIVNYTLKAANVIMYGPRAHSPINYGLYRPRRTLAQDRRVALASLASALRRQRRGAWAADMSEGMNCILPAFSTLVGKCPRLLSRDRLVQRCIPST